MRKNVCMNSHGLSIIKWLPETLWTYIMCGAMYILFYFSNALQRLTPLVAVQRTTYDFVGSECENLPTSRD